jgi:branched-chain amino acid aminotransferase
MEAVVEGYSEGIALDTSGQISEGSGQNLFLVRDGILYTPPLSAAILPGITRNSIIQIARDLGFTVLEEPLPRELLYIVDEAFFVGTAAEVTPIKSVDRITVGSGRRGPVTEALQKAFFAVVNGETPDRHGWLSYVYPGEPLQPVGAAAAPPGARRDR